MILSWLNGDKVYDSKGQRVTEFFFKKNGKFYSKKKVKFESPKSILSEIPDTQAARMEVEGLLGSQDVFPYPKPTDLIKRLLSLTTEDGDIVLDFFSGSGSTAHAVFKKAVSKKVRFIVVQIAEELDKSDVDNKVAIDFCHNLGVPANIADISKERIRRAGKKIKEENADKKGIENLDTGFRVFKIDSSNMVDVTLSPDEAHPDMFKEHVGNIKKDRSSEDLLFQVLLDWGVDLSLPIKREKIEDKEVFFVDGNALAACFDEYINENFVKKLAEKQPLRVVFRDDGFKSDSVKINVEQIFKLKSPATDIKVI